MHILTRLLLGSLLAAQIAFAAGSPVAGTWRGSMHGLPAAVLTIKDEGGKLSGTIQFYFQHRGTEQDPWQVDTAHPTGLSLLEPKFDGTTLSFQVSHKKAHPPRTLNDPPSSFQLRLTEKNKADLLHLTERQGPALPMLRDVK